MAQTVNHWLLIADSGVQPQASQCGNRLPISIILQMPDAYLLIYHRRYYG